MELIGRLGGRKFILAIIAVVAIGLHNWLGIDVNSVYTIGGIIATFIFGQSFADGMSGGTTSTTTPTVDPAEVARINMATAIAENHDDETELVTAQTAAINAGLDPNKAQPKSLTTKIAEAVEVTKA